MVQPSSSNPLNINIGAMLPIKLQTLFKYYQFSRSCPFSIPKPNLEIHTLHLDV